LKKLIRPLLLTLLIILVFIQFIRPPKNNGQEIAQLQITALHPIPEDVKQVLAISCYDCHSNTTVYPWYAKIQPVYWFLNDHITAGKRHLNFSTFSSAPVFRQYKMFKEIQEQVKTGEMPLASYTLIHRDAVLNETQKELIINWASNSMKAMESVYPQDSLVKKKPAALPKD
jgi:Haem-binding domain